MKRLVIGRETHSCNPTMATCCRFAWLNRADMYGQGHPCDTHIMCLLFAAIKVAFYIILHCIDK